MVIYPVPPAVKQARVQLSIDETAKGGADNDHPRFGGKSLKLKSRPTKPC